MNLPTKCKLLILRAVKVISEKFYLLLNARLGIILVNNELDANLFSIYVYFDTLHVSSNHVLIIRRINCIIASGICHCVGECTATYIE